MNARIFCAYMVEQLVADEQTKNKLQISLLHIKIYTSDDHINNTFFGSIRTIFHIITTK